MTKDEIIRMALESGFAKILDEHASEYRNFTFELSQDQYPELGRFANLVAAAEREACADIVDNADTPDCGGWNALGISRAIRARGTT